MEHTHRAFSLRTNCLIPTSRIWTRFSIMLMPYFVRYRLSNCFSLAQGKLPQRSEQYLLLPVARCSQFLILHLVRQSVFCPSALRQPGHVFLSRMYAQQRRQFIPQGAIALAGIAVVFVRSLAVMAAPVYDGRLRAPAPASDA